MNGNLRSLKILFISICIVYTIRMIQYLMELTTSTALADTLDPYILVAKTVMIFGLFLSIYLRIESANGNVQTDIDLVRSGSIYLLHNGDALDESIHNEDEDNEEVASGHHRPAHDQNSSIVHTVMPPNFF
jgi:hypothetical protein